MELITERLKLKDLFPEKAKKYAQKLHIRADEIPFIRKSIAIDPEDIKVEERERAAVRLVSTPHLDRDSEILIPDGAVYSLPMSVLYAHDYRGLPIGSDRWIKTTEKGILAKTYYAKHQFAEDVFQCVKDKHLNSNSVGFIPVEVIPSEDKKIFGEWQDILEKDYGIEKEESSQAKNIYTKWIMLEHSDVPVASNRQSLNLAVAKGELVIESEQLRKDLEIEIISKPEETDDFIRIPVRTCEVTATIDISKKDGIKALYCGKIKKVRTYLFDKRDPYNWTMARAKKWVEEHKGKSLDKILVEYEDQKQAKYKCECIKCGHKETYEDHCDKHKCPECGGQMRRVERPGPGKGVDEKEGRVLSTKNRKLINDCVEQMENGVVALKELMEATEPPEKEPPKPEKKKVEITSEDIVEALDKQRKDLAKRVEQLIEDKLNHLLGKV